MAVMDNMSDFETPETKVSVHSPVIQNSKKGAYYTSYALSLKSNDSCFTLSQSCVRRRYSEFVHLRRLLKSHHPNIEPPLLPPKNYFGRFDATFVSHRAGGLEDFLKGILEVPVYLSNKGVHLFLQTFKPMSEIDKMVSDTAPTTPAISSQPLYMSSYEESSSSGASTGSEFPIPSSEFGDRLAIDTKDMIDECDVIPPLEVQKVPTMCSTPIPITKKKMRNCLIATRTGALVASNYVSDSSEPGSNASTPDSALSSPRRVSFNEKVTVAVIGDKFRNIAVKPIKTGGPC